MKQLIKQAGALAALCVMGIGVAYGEAPVPDESVATALEVMNECRKVINYWEASNPPDPAALDAYAMGACAARINTFMGFYELIEGMGWMTQELKICFPEKVSAEQLIRVAQKHIEERPEALNNKWIVQAYAAFHRAFPCPR